jgi:hypothetical protein
MRLRLLAILGVTAAVLFGWAGTASAKGPVGAVVTGAELDGPVSVSGSEGGDNDFWRLVDQAGFFPAVFLETPDPMLDAAPVDEGALGPAFTVSWQLPSDRGTATLVTIVYPYAANGPLAYTEPGQPLYESQTTRGGWYQAPSTLTTTFERLTGTTAATASAAATPTTTAPPPPTQAAPTTSAPAAGSRAGWPVLLTVGFVVAAAAGLTTARHVRRRVRVSAA